VVVSAAVASAGAVLSVPSAAAGRAAVLEAVVVSAAVASAGAVLSVPSAAAGRTAVLEDAAGFDEALATDASFVAALAEAEADSGRATACGGGSADRGVPLALPRCNRARSRAGTFFLPWPAVVGMSNACGCGCLFVGAGAMFSLPGTVAMVRWRRSERDVRELPARP